MAPRSLPAEESQDSSSSSTDPASRAPEAVPRRLSTAYAGLLAGSRLLGPVESELRGLSRIIRPGDVCIDVGAEYGLYTVPLSVLVGPGGRIVAVEPIAELARWLRHSMGMLGARWCSVTRVALGARTGGGVLSVPVRHGLPVHGRSYLVEGALHHGSNDEFSSESKRPVQMQTFDQLCGELRIDRLDFVKFDIEGAELAVLADAQMIWRLRPMIMLEIEERHLARYGKRAADVVELLTEQQYRMHGWIDDEWRPLSGLRTGMRNYLFCPIGLTS